MFDTKRRIKAMEHNISILFKLGVAFGEKKRIAPVRKSQTMTVATDA
jgi:hypothetical protein